jgi:hypothetical protein
MASSHLGFAGVVCFCLLCSAACGARTELNDDLTTTTSTPPTDAGPDATVPCIPGTFGLQRATPTVMFVLDASGSMTEQFSFNGDDRWTVLQNSLGVALPSVDQSMAIGAVIFPINRSDHSCDAPTTVDLSPALGNVNPLLNLLAGTTPLGGTPTADSIDVGATALLQIRAASSARAIILATDGGPNCNINLDYNTCTCANPEQNNNSDCTQDGQKVPDGQLCLDDTRTVSRISGYAAQGLPTYVIGIHDPGDTQDNTVLNAMANAGGRPQTGGTEQYYEATSQADLEGAFVSIRNQLGSCTYLTTSVPNGKGTIVVTVNGTIVPFDPSGKQGWKWGDEANGEIIFAGNACAEISSPEAGTQKITANVSCNVPDASVPDASFVTDASISDSGDDAD